MTAVLLFSLCAASLSGCGEDDPHPTPNDLEETFTPPSQVKFRDAREAALAQYTETARFNAEEGLDFTSEDGTRLRIAPGCVADEEGAVSGEVELTFVDLFHRKEMVAANRPTMGRRPDGTKATLISGGEFLVEVSQGGTQLTSACDYHLDVPAANTGGVDEEMLLWTGTIDEDGDLTWDPVKEDATGRGGLFVENESYVVITGQFGWTNIDRFHNDPREKTTMRVKAPEGFDYSNSAVYLSYDGEPNALAQLDTYDEALGVFSEHYGQIPIGLQVHLVFVTLEGDDWRYAIQAATIEADAVYTFEVAQTQVGSLDEFVSALDALP